MENNNGKQRPTVSRSEFTTQAISNGLTRPQLASHFGIKESQVTKIAKTLNITLKRNVVPSINLVD